MHLKEGERYTQNLILSFSFFFSLCCALAPSYLKKKMEELKSVTIHVKEEEQVPYIQPSFCTLKSELGWKEASKQWLINYFPHYKYKPHGTHTHNSNNHTYSYYIY